MLHTKRGGLFSIFSARRLITTQDVYNYCHFYLVFQGFPLGSQAILLTSVFHEGLSFMDVSHKPMCISMFTVAAVGSRGCCESPFGYFSYSRFSNSLSIKTQNGKSCEHITKILKTMLNLFEHVDYLNFLLFNLDLMEPRSQSFFFL